MFKHILVATDGSELAKKAVDTAISLAAVHGATLYAVTVVPDYPRNLFQGASAKVPEEIARLEKAWAESAKKVLDKIAEQAAAQKVKVEPIIATSTEVADAVLAAAKKHKCDLIVMASHGRKGLSRLLLGSETQHVLTQTTLPVLVLR